jgi:nucleotide-binding universal stress UspA family protein
MSTLQDQRRIVVGVDGSPEALRAVEWATGEARRRGASLRLVTALDWTYVHVVGVPGLGQETGDMLRGQASASLEEAAAVATGLDPDIDVDQHLAAGFPIGMLVGESRHAGLLVVGEGGLGRIASVVAGSVAVGVATHAACPVVVVRGAEHAGPEPAPIVVGVDGGPVGEAAIAFAYEAAAARGAPLIAVHAWGDPPGDLRTAPLWEEFVDEAERVLAERLAGWGEKYPDVPVQRIVSHSLPSRRLLELSAKAQLVVVGSRGHGELAGLVLGSVSNAMVHRAACPVVVVRPGAAAQS